VILTESYRAKPCHARDSAYLVREIPRQQQGLIQSELRSVPKPIKRGHWPIVPVRGRLEPSVELPDSTRIPDLQMPTVIIGSLTRAGFLTAGDVRKAANREIGRIRGIGPQALRYLREKLGP
jgi:hypothetical protein